MSSDKQSRFRETDSFTHIPITFRSLPRQEYGSGKPRKKKRRFAKKSSIDPEELTSALRRIHSLSSSREKIVHDPYLYFVVNFSDKLSWDPIQKTIRDLELSIVEIVDDKTIKAALRKDRYEWFLYALPKKSTYIEKLKETSYYEKIDAELIQELRDQPDKSGWFSFELSNLSGIENKEEILAGIKRYVSEKNLGTGVEECYFSKTLFILDAYVGYSTVTEIAEQVEVVSKVTKIPKIALEANLAPQYSKEAKTLIPSSPLQSIFHPVCIIDSGINKDHAFLKDLVEYTYDYTTQQNGPCGDNDGHGSGIAGIAIYGGDLRTFQDPRTKIVMIKDFENGELIERNILKVIFETVIRTKPQNQRMHSRVLNLSFSSEGPIPSFTKALDEIIFGNDLVLVTCAGNIKPAYIQDYLLKGTNFPQYTTNHKIFFPGDCRNAVTVGSFTDADSNIAPAGPSPFTKSSPMPDLVKPETLAPGGTLRAIYSGHTITSITCSGLGLQTASNVDSQLKEAVGTSFSSPAVAHLAACILSCYPSISAPLLKALILNSCNTDKPEKDALDFIKGFGKPEKDMALHSKRWRVSYLLEGQFRSDDQNIRHRYRFLFPDNADLIQVTLVCHKLHTTFQGEKFDYVRLKFIRPGIKLSVGSGWIPETERGRKRCFATYKASQKIKRGNKGPWIVDVIPHFQYPFRDQQIKYGCVIMVASSKYRDVYKHITRYLKPKISVPYVTTKQETKESRDSVIKG